MKRRPYPAGDVRDPVEWEDYESQLEEYEEYLDGLCDRWRDEE